jgi:hypothetical protein
MNKQTIIIKDTVASTLSNADAMPLKLALDQALKNGTSVILSFEGIRSISSSFLNSSIGDIVDSYGFDVLKNRITITHYTPTLADVIKKYISDLRDFESA